MYGDLTGANLVKTANPAGARIKPRIGVSAGRQFPGIGLRQPSACGVIDERGGVLEDAKFPYWRMLLWGCEPVYRMMARQQTLALARYIVTGPIRASIWDYTHDDSIDKGDPAIRWLKDNILSLRRKVMREALRAVDYGWQPFAIPWTIRDGMYCPDVRPLLPEATTVMQDQSGAFAGLENAGEFGKATQFNDLESWAPTLGGEAGYAYGSSRFENVRTTAWAPWLNTVMRVRELEAKLSGIVPIVSHPPGGYKDDDNNSVEYATEADTILNELPHGRGVRIETALDVAQLLEYPEFAAKLAELKLFDVQFLDAGSVSPALVGFISLLEYWDKQLFRGMLRGERAGLEAVAAGSRADSEQHTETGAADSESIDADLTESFDEGPFRTALRLNFGDDKARRIHIISTPLQTWKKQIFREMLTRLVSIPDIAVDVSRSLDMDAMFSQMSMPQIRDFVVSAVTNPPNTAPADSGLKEPPPSDGKSDEAKAELLATRLHQTFSK
jgi:hypothetical protein